MNSPKPGEYWYIKSCDGYSLFYIMMYKDGIYYGKYCMLFPFLYMKSSELSYKFIQKWEPNWFWRIFGFK